MLTQWNRADLWLVAYLFAAIGCAGGEGESTEEDVLLGSAAEASCVAQPEFGSWYHQTFGSPHLLELRGSPGDCGTRAIIWELQANGSLWQRGNFASHVELLDDGSRWLAVDAVPVGGYVAHHWLRFDESDGRRLRVWTHYESLDSKPDAVEDHWYRPDPPRTSDETFRPRSPRTLER